MRRNKRKDDYTNGWTAFRVVFLHAVSKRSALVRVIERCARKTNGAKGTAKATNARESTVRQAGVRAALKDIGINRLVAESTVKLRSNMAAVRAIRTHALRALERVDAILRAINVRQRVALVKTSASSNTTHGLTTEGKDRGLVIASASTIVIHLLTLKLVLDTLAVGSVANQRKYRADALDEQRTLVGLGIVQGSLDTVVSIRVTQQLLETSTVQELLDEDLASAVFGNTDTLYG